MPAIRRLSAIAALALCAACATATELTLTDGSVVVGEIVRENTDFVTIDTVFGSARGNMTIGRDRIAKTVEGPVPEGFYDRPKAEARAPTAAKFAPGDHSYMEVPITGRFGEDVFAAGIERNILYAQRNRISDLVFVIDSADSGDIDEGIKVFRALDQAKGVTCRAIVRQAVGDSIGILLVCKSVHVLPGARIGGFAGKPREGESPEDLATLRHQVAQNAGRAATRLGRSPALIRAMLDPAEAVVGWIDAAGKNQFTPEAPADAAQVVFTNKPGEVLVLSYEQLQKFKVPTLAGGADSLGAVLGFEAWKAEGDYGKRAMADTAKQEQTSRAAKEKALARKSESILNRREEAQAALKHNLGKAGEYDPDKGTYATYQNYGGYGWDGGGDSNQFTSASAKDWTQRSDLCVAYLGEAIKAVYTLRNTDKEAAKIGLEAAYKQGELDRLYTDLETRRQLINYNRNRREK